MVVEDLAGRGHGLTVVGQHTAPAMVGARYSSGDEDPRWRHKKDGWVPWSSTRDWQRYFGSGLAVAEA